ncbi:MAG: acetoacetate--CoA ligase [Gammaproteobacteria bacterium]|nr:MAG: acetoacetate--CoA ligase [Gammaproteobacteria bacterium]TLZ61635.1 MAG: acetoacetate--CoA ligase [Gammaproteobacteria bacterium]
MANVAPESELWRPSAARIRDANLTRFTSCVNARRGTRLGDYSELYAWSLAEPAAFWSELARFADVRAEWGAGPVIEHLERMPGARFFPQARLNFAENLLRFDDGREALVFRNECGARRSLSHRELRGEVARVAGGLRAAGVAAGDRVAGFVPNLPEAAIAMLATATIGAIWSSCSPDFGVRGVLDRFGQIAPRVLFTADGYFYAGKQLDSLESMSEVLAKLPSVERVVVIPYAEREPGLARLGAAASRAILWQEFGSGSAPPEFALHPFSHPLYILYSSGTTGVPKCIVHGAGGTLLQHQKEHLLHTDLKRSDRLFYFTTCGWMMWNWLMSGLACGATLVLYDGSPLHPQPGVLWHMADEERITIFGTSAKYLAALEKSTFVPAQSVDLTALRTLLSTGSPLLPEGFDYVYRSVKSDLQLASISGGTDIVSCFALGCPTRPVYRGELQCRGLGMAVDIFDDAGSPARGERGELVCTAPFPSMPVGFWNDPDGARYRAAYFERFPGVWHHGDYAALTAHDGLVIYGRSDAVLNPGGVRIGTAEIYSAVESLPQILEALAVGQDWQGDVRVVLFVRVKGGVELDEALQKEIRNAIRAQTTPRHVPAKIIAVPDIPRTLSGKVTELAVRNVIHGLPVKNVDALANAGALDYFRDLPDLQS